MASEFTSVSVEDLETADQSALEVARLQVGLERLQEAFTVDVRLAGAWRTKIAEELVVSDAWQTR